MRAAAQPPALPFVRSGAARLGVNRLGVLSLLLFAAACASTPPVVPPVTPGPGPVSPSTPVEGLSLTALPGWAEEDHLAAFNAYVAGCVRARGGAAEAVCARARDLAARRASPSDARAFLETNFVATEARTDDGRAGLLTAYFAPEYAARRAPDAEFDAPVLSRPANLSEVGDRAAIEAGSAQSSALAWMR
ncbi:MAG TPA: MltA domain-containing protein, partial [Brevundimonas sp.]|nr:MltA domain-containing protein [Brevundimonas sp.]